MLDSINSVIHYKEMPPLNRLQREGVKSIIRAGGMHGKFELAEIAESEADRMNNAPCSSRIC